MKPKKITKGTVHFGRNRPAQIRNRGEFPPFAVGGFAGQIQLTGGEGPDKV
jgi:hypothetical protein